MTINRHRAVKPSSSSGSTAEGFSTRTGPRRLSAFAAALAATVLMLSGTPAAAAPTFNQTSNVGAYPGVLVSVTAEANFDNPGTNARFTDVEFSTTEWYSESEILAGRLWVTAMTADELNALADPPPTPFTVTATVTMTNDEGETATGTFTFETDYARTESITPVVVKPTFRSQDGTVSLPLSISTLMSLRAEYNFDNAGTNPRFTDVTFSTTEWYSESGITNGVIWIKTKTAAELNALASPPPNPFTVTVTATMTNDEGQTASGTFALETTYAREEKTSATSVVAKPTFDTRFANLRAPIGSLVIVSAESTFDNAGTNARFTEVSFSTTEWYSESGIVDGKLSLRTKTAADLNALSSPPPSPFTVTATVKMTNDEGQTASGTFTFETSYARTESTTPAPVGPAPTPIHSTSNATVAVLLSHRISASFNNAGTNPKFTAVTFDKPEYLDVPPSGDIVDPGNVAGEESRFWLRTKTSEQLRALSSPPPNPFTVTATVTMTNDEGHTATSTVSFNTTYAIQVGPAPTPIHSTRVAPVAVLLSHWVSQSFTNAGTNAKFTEVTFDKPEYLDVPPSGNIETASNGDTLFWLRTKTAEQLRALLSPPPTPFTVKATAKMANDEGHTATVTSTFETEYTTQIADIPPSKTPISSPVDVVEMPPGDYHPLTADKLFNNPGTNARFTAVDLSTSEYYDSASIAQSGVHAGLFIVQVKSLADLKAMDSLPASPIRVTATVTMVNDEGATGTRTVTFKTAYEEDEESEAEEPSVAEEPTAEPTAKTGIGAFNASAGALTSITADQVFDNAGTNAKFTNVDFDSTYYYSGAGFSDAGQVWVKVKTDAELNALNVVPPSPFTVTATVEMTNDEGQTATGTVSFKTTYVKPDSPSGGPTPKQLAVLNVPPGSDIFGTTASAYFNNVGTNARLTGVVFTTLDYYEKRDTGICREPLARSGHTLPDAALSAAW